jgi:hypothetical protein
MSAEIQANIAELNVRATRRLGEISAGLEKGKHSGNQYGNVRAADNSKTKNPRR